MDKEYKDEQIGDLDGDEGVNPLNFIGEDGELQEDDDEDMIDYGELSDGDLDMGS